MEAQEARTKTCPYCAETILAAAIKCKYCGERLDHPTSQSAQAGVAASPLISVETAVASPGSDSMSSPGHSRAERPAEAASSPPQHAIQAPLNQGFTQQGAERPSESSGSTPLSPTPVKFPWRSPLAFFLILWAPLALLHAIEFAVGTFSVPITRMILLGYSILYGALNSAALTAVFGIPLAVGIPRLDKLGGRRAALGGIAVVGILTGITAWLAWSVVARGLYKSDPFITSKLLPVFLIIASVGASAEAWLLISKSSAPLNVSTLYESSMRNRSTLALLCLIPIALLGATLLFAQAVAPSSDNRVSFSFGKNGRKEGAYQWANGKWHGLELGFDSAEGYLKYEFVHDNGHTTSARTFNKDGSVRPSVQPSPTYSDCVRIINSENPAFQSCLSTPSCGSSASDSTRRECYKNCLGARTRDFGKCVTGDGYLSLDNAEVGWVWFLFSQKDLHRLAGSDTSSSDRKAYSEEVLRRLFAPTDPALLK